MLTSQNHVVMDEAEWLAVSAPLDLLEQYCWVEISDLPPCKSRVQQALERIGQLVPQYGGTLFWDVVPLKTGEKSSIGDREISLHTELAEFQTPPDYMALYCIRASSQGGRLVLFDTRGFIDRLPKARKEALSKIPMRIALENPISDTFGELETNAPVLELEDGRWALRLDQDFIDLKSDPMIRAFQADLLNEAKSNSVELHQAEGALLIWDNKRILHGRSGFSDLNRHLWRCCIKSSQKP